MSSSTGLTSASSFSPWRSQGVGRARSWSAPAAGAGAARPDAWLASPRPKAKASGDWLAAPPTIAPLARPSWVGPSWLCLNEKAPTRPAALPPCAQAAAPSASARFDVGERRARFAKLYAHVEEKMGRWSRRASHDVTWGGVVLALASSSVLPIVGYYVAPAASPFGALAAAVLLGCALVGACIEMVCKHGAFAKVGDDVLRELDRLYEELYEREARLGAARGVDEIDLLKHLAELMAQMVGGPRQVLRHALGLLLHWTLPCPRFVPGALIAARYGDPVRAYSPPQGATLCVA